MILRVSPYREIGGVLAEISVTIRPYEHNRSYIDRRRFRTKNKNGNQMKSVKILKWKLHFGLMRECCRFMINVDADGKGVVGTSLSWKTGLLYPRHKY